ncbi:MAG: hypothetical protein AAF194_08410, partial [Pseudomonadota bacterium]
RLRRYNGAAGLGGHEEGTLLCHPLPPIIHGWLSKVPTSVLRELWTCCTHDRTPTWGLTALLPDQRKAPGFFYDLTKRAFVPMPRPIPLKNESIAAAKAAGLRLEHGPLYENTRKGDVCHFFPDEHSFAYQRLNAHPKLIAFPSFQKAASLEVTRELPHVVLTRLTNNAFNYMVCGEDSFRAATELARDVPAYHLRYSEVDSAIARIDELMR